MNHWIQEMMLGPFKREQIIARGVFVYQPFSKARYVGNGGMINTHSMVSGSYDQGEAGNAGKTEHGGHGDRAAGCPHSKRQ